MKFSITAHPIDRKYQEELGIYHDSKVATDDVGRIIDSLVEKGHHVVNAYIEDGTIHFHCSKK